MADIIGFPAGRQPTRAGFKAEALRLMAESRLALSAHARLRMMEGNVTMDEVTNGIRRGHVSEDPYRDVRGNWRASMTRTTSDGRLDIALAIDVRRGLIVVTVI